MMSKKMEMKSKLKSAKMEKQGGICTAEDLAQRIVTQRRQKLPLASQTREMVDLRNNRWKQVAKCAEKRNIYQLMWTSL